MILQEAYIDHRVQEDGTIKRRYNLEDYNIDNVNGKDLVLLYDITGKKKVPQRQLM